MVRNHGCASLPLSSFAEDETICYYEGANVRRIGFKSLKTVSVKFIDLILRTDWLQRYFCYFVIILPSLFNIFRIRLKKNSRKNFNTYNNLSRIQEKISRKLRNVVISKKSDAT